MWVLNHLKVVKPDGSDFAYDRDYAGFHPLPEKKFRVQSLPDSLEGVDLLYIADTYGVYASEYYLGDTRGKFSSLLYGGLEVKEAGQIQDAVRKGTALIAEFNSFATPTGAEARRILSETLGVEWSGWVGRIFDNLHRSGEVPLWAVQGYERQYGEPWNFSGPGLLFVHDDGRLVVLSTRNDISRDGVTFEIEKSNSGAIDAKSGLPYLYWFDVVRVPPGASVLARYQLNVSEVGKEKILKAGIPDSFPAVMRKMEGQVPVFYFAGDFADIQGAPFTWKIWGLEFFYRLLPMNPRVKPEVFFWNVYLPLMEHLLSQISDRK
ncbi:MAG: hypothetical protein HYT87_05440 [Nitrospirae bacterium]|nr:hypothetical protein [Nitrospirota bacterium]